MADPRRRIAGTDVLLADPRSRRPPQAFGRPARQGGDVAAQATRQGRRDRAGGRARRGPGRAAGPDRAPVINATGVLVHTNLGRAPLSAAARDALVAAAGCTRRGVRPGHRAARAAGAPARWPPWPARCPPPGGVHVVNNNAAALVLCATALAAGREIVISRGELVEIGDGFRHPRPAGQHRRPAARGRHHQPDAPARTTPARSARTPRSCSRCTRRTSASTASPPACRRRPSWPGSAPPVVVDIGSGLLAPHPLLPDEPDAATALRAGAALVTASGDKLLGGPQAGLLLGRADLVAAAAPASAGPGAAGGQADPGRAGGDPARPGAAGARGAGRRPGRRCARGPTRWPSGWPRPASTPWRWPRAAVGGGGAPGVRLASAAVSLPERFAGRAAHGRPAGGRPARARPLPAGPAHASTADDDASLAAAVLSAARCR